MLRLPLPVLDALPLGAHRLISLTDEGLYRACGVRVAFTGRDGGVSKGCYAALNCATHVGDDPNDIARNKEIVCEAVGATAKRLVSLNQVHGTRIVAMSGADGVDDIRTRAAQGADGIIVESAGVTALLNAADCLLVVVVSPSGRFVAAHAGWRGAVAGIAGKAVRMLAEGDPCSAEGFNAYLSPHIRHECFEVGEDVQDVFRAEFGESTITSHRHVSLARAVTIDLVRAGMDEKRIADSGICTKCHADRYFSYRATDGVCGRNAVAVVRSDTRPSVS